MNKMTVLPGCGCALRCDVHQAAEGWRQVAQDVSDMNVRLADANARLRAEVAELREKLWQRGTEVAR